MHRSLLALVAFAVVSLTVPAHAQICTPFTEVVASDPFCANIQWMFNRGVTLGCHGQGQPAAYCPAQFVRRDQMAAFMNRLADDAVFQRDGNAWGETAVLGTKDPQAVEVIAGGSRVMRYHNNSLGASSSPNLVGGYPGNTVDALHIGQTIAGGGTGGDDCFNPLTGTNNRSCANHAEFSFATVSGGIGNLAVGGTVAGGELNTASGLGSFVAGGVRNIASGSYAFGAGYAAVANQTRCFVFSGWSSGASISCLGSGNVARFGLDHGLSVDYFSRRADGGGNRWVYIGDLIGGQTIATWKGAFLSDAGVWVDASSSKVSKTDFAPVDTREVLDNVAALPITTWRYREGEGEVRHIGPMAEDFHAAFKVGYGAHTIADLDARGVALAAIQGLNAKLEAMVAEQADENARLRSELAGLRSLKEEVASIRAAQSRDSALRDRTKVQLVEPSVRR